MRILVIACIAICMFVSAATAFVSDSVAQTFRPGERGNLTAREVAKRTFPSVVLLAFEQADGKTISQGSGFFVHSDTVVTNYHVLAGATRGAAKIVGRDAAYSVAGVVAVSESLDLALLKVPGAKAPALMLGHDADVAVGDEVYVAGNPRGLEGTFSQGIVSAIRLTEKRRLLQITAPISPGSSGGPVLNSQGKVIGVAVSTLRDSQNLNFAVAVGELHRLLSQIGPLRPFPLAQGSTLAAKPPEPRRLPDPKTISPVPRPPVEPDPVFPKALGGPKLLPSALTDPAFLRSRTWKSDPGLEKAVSDWPLYGGKQGYENKTVLRRVELQVAGVKFEADYRVFLKDPLAEIVLIGTKFDESFCLRFLEWTTSLFGAPAKHIDMSSGTWSQIDADWLLGATRVKFSCRGIVTRALDGGSFVPGVATLVYRHQTMLKALEDLIYIECSSTITGVGSFADQRSQQGTPIRFVIDPNGNSLLRWDKSTIGETERYSDEEIVVAWSLKGDSSVLRLDRRAGSYLIQVRFKGDERSGLDHWGKCSRTTPEKKF